MESSVSGIAGLVTVKEAARLLRVTSEAVRLRISRNRLQIVRVGKTILVRLSDLRLTAWCAIL